MRAIVRFCIAVILFFLCGSLSYSHAVSSPDGTHQYRPRLQNMRMPAEWEEIRAVIISCPYLQYTPQDDPKEVYENFRILNSVWAKLAAAIQEECEVWIRVRDARDTIAIKKIMEHNATPLKRYKFIIFPGENFWVRDYGPLGFFYSNKDSLGIIDTRYQHHQSYQDPSDSLPPYIAATLKARLLTTDMYFEGGNLETDGFGTGFFTSRVHRLNADYYHWETSSVLDTMSAVFGLKNMVELRDLPCDGGTGHIDMFFKMLDEETIALAQFPESVASSDRVILEENFEKLSNLLSVRNKPYRIVRIPMPSIEGDELGKLDCGHINVDPKSYLNGLFVNKSFLLPVFSNAHDGDRSQDSSVIEIFKKILPGYKIVPIDSRILSVLRGGIHCVTMQVPAENPILIKLLQAPKYQELPSRYYAIKAEIQNRDGIRSASIYWRVKGEVEWQYERMAQGKNNIFFGQIDAERFQMGDTIEYYVQAKSYNGKKINKPMTAPEGYHSFVIYEPKILSGGLPFSKQNSGEYEVLVVAPAPSSDFTNISVIIPEEGEYSIIISGISGQEMDRICVNKQLQPGRHVFSLPVSKYPSGLYACITTTKDQIVAVRKFHVQH
ncbi:MAG TPA: agmatine deiminase family protein [Patescibacteria group bacterium]|nr:agmatine deiminase family protein [Patescibacteria group bacterium]